jgi:SAM-dependent methyltransferase
MNDDSTKPHSADYLGPPRDFLWNGDFLDLIGKRWQLGGVRRVLDLGCGAGHWSRMVLPRCHPEAALVGIDREPSWIDLAGRHAQALGWGARATYQQGDVMNLTALGGGFDLVTCQTLLIHLADPIGALEAMIGQLRPGGRLLVAEPNNRAGFALGDTLDAITPMDERLARLRFYWICETGKKNLGFGDNSLGDRVAELFARAGLKEIQAYKSDKVVLLLPPYATPEQVAEREEMFERERDDFVAWDRKTTYSHFIAGGGDPASFETCWANARESLHRVADGVRNGTYFGTWTGVFYLVSGLRP